MTQSTSLLNCAIFCVSGVDSSTALGDEPGDAAGLGLVAGGPHDALGLAAGDERAGEGEVLAVGENRVQRERVGVLGHRQRFAGERGFVDVQVAHVEEPQVGGHAVAGLQQHDVARHEFLGGDAQLASVAPHRGLGGDHPASASMAFSALASWRKPTTALMNTTPKMTDESTHSPRNAVTPTATSRM